MLKTFTVCPFEDCGRVLTGMGLFCHSCSRYPSDFREDAPTAPVVNRNDPRSEKEIQCAVKNALQAMGFSVWDTSQPFQAKITPGLPDLFVTGRGLCAWVEVKSAKGKLSPAQDRFRELVTTNGGLHFVARHEADVAAWAEQLTMRLSA